MSSPFNPLAALTPAFPTPGALPALAGLSPAPLHPFLQSPSGQAGTLTSPFAAGTPWLSHLGLPGSVPSLPSLPAGGGLSGGSGMGLGAQQQQSQGGLQGAGTANGATADADDALRAMPEISRLVERAEAVRAEMALLEKNMFGKKGEGAERQGGGLSRLEALQLDYAQTLLALIQLSSAYLVGALPVPLSTAAPGTSTGGADSTSTGAVNTTTSTPNAAELAAWTEARAQAQFARREAVKNASKAVVDVLKGGRQG
ncbi:uncharacterized protein EHS24_005973 [Apiotrichum porosum]|uniref:Uncharacterized protein n=1 Tax=Apiotrichum porosum TaxID=105984 RepID=A0A427Y059_9TREE|nr:uncharacterized protein EHS24_005973 [Apiotrichum porosum]RSH84452.1 hypothetical protein EHS24_005973 [Apiotrichum porosum]